MNLTLGFSPCPNDTFIFDALLHQKIDTEGLHFLPLIVDVEELNRRSFLGQIDITKISFAAYSKITERYQLLDAGSALGKNCGPLIISLNKIVKEQSSLKKIKIAIPGINTTANFLLHYFFPEAINKYECLFSEIENEVLSGRADAGLIIHESRFTYESKGLKKFCDLGELWETETATPLPLGGIAVRRDIELLIKQKINRVLMRSVEFAFANPLSSRDFVKQHSQELSDDVIQKHIELYVNEYSKDLGIIGKKAIELFLSKINQAPFNQNVFLNT